MDATPAEIARAYFDALAAHDLDAAVAVWRPGAIDRIVGDRDLVAPDGLREYFGGTFAAFPDFVHNDAFTDSGDVARQLGPLP